MVTRSILAMLADMSSYVRVPESDITEGRALPGAPQIEGLRHPLDVRCDKHQPADAYVKIRHRGNWYWISDDDMHSKRTFFSLMLMSTLAESSDAAQAPLLTLSAG